MISTKPVGGTTDFIKQFGFANMTVHAEQSATTLHALKLSMLNYSSSKFN
jgi:hypothetical protein